MLSEISFVPQRKILKSKITLCCLTLVLQVSDLASTIESLTPSSVVSISVWILLETKLLGSFLVNHLKRKNVGT